MAIYDLFELEGRPEKESHIPHSPQEVSPEVSSPSLAGKKERIFSAVAARLFFLILFAADVIWFFGALLVFLFSALGYGVTGGKIAMFSKLNERMRLTIKRSLVCGVSLLITLFSPAFGIMIACTYFLMYDPKGIEEVVPSSLQSQFKEYFQK